MSIDSGSGPISPRDQIHSVLHSNLPSHEKVHAIEKILQKTAESELVKQGKTSQKFVMNMCKKTTMPPKGTKEYKQVVEKFSGQFKDLVNSYKSDLKTFFSQNPETRDAPPDTVDAFIEHAANDQLQTHDIPETLSMLSDDQSQIVAGTTLTPSTQTSKKSAAKSRAQSISPFYMHLIKEIAPSFKQTGSIINPEVMGLVTAFDQASSPLEAMAIYQELSNVISQQGMTQSTTSTDKQKTAKSPTTPSFSPKIPNLPTPPTPPTSINQALNEAKNWMNQLDPSSSAYTLASDLVNVIQSHPSWTSISNLTSFIQAKGTDPQDIYMQFPGIDYKNASAFYFICGLGKAPPKTPVDALYDGVQLILSSPEIGSDPKGNYGLFKALSDEIYSVGSDPKNFSEVTTWVKDNIKTSDFPNASKDAKYIFGVLTGAVEDIDQLTTPKFMTVAGMLAWFIDSKLPPGSPGDKFLTDLIDNCFGTRLGLNGYEGYKELYQKYYGTNDPYMQYPNISPALVGIFSALAGTFMSGGGLETPMDRIHTFAVNKKNEIEGKNPPKGSPQAILGEFYQALAKETSSLGSNGSLSDLGTWFKSASEGKKFDLFEGVINDLANDFPPDSAEGRFLFNVQAALTKSDGSFSEFSSIMQADFSTWDPYMQFPGLTSKEGIELVSFVTKVAGISWDAKPTSADIMNAEAAAWGNQAAPGSPEANLANEIQNIFSNQTDPLGSFQGTQPVTTWAETTVINNNFEYYSGISIEGAQTFIKITKAAPNSLEVAYNFAVKLNNIVQKDPASNPDQKAFTSYIAGQALKAIQNPNGTLEDFQNAVNDAFSTQDVYMSYPGVGQPLVAAVYSLLGEAIPIPTLTDIAYTAANIQGYSKLASAIYNKGSFAPISGVIGLVEFKIFKGVMQEIDTYFDKEAPGSPTTAFIDHVTQILNNSDSYSAYQSSIEAAFQTCDPYMSYPGLSEAKDGEEIVKLVYTSVGGDFSYQTPNSSPPPDSVTVVWDGSPTALDQEFQKACDQMTTPFQPGQEPSGQGNNALFYGLAETIYSSGSFAADGMSQATSWAETIVSSDFKDYPNSTIKGQMIFLHLSGTSTANPLQKAGYESALLEEFCIQTYGPSSPEATLTEYLFSTIQSVISHQGTITDLPGQFSQFSDQDVYMQYPGINEDLISACYDIVYQTTGEHPPTKMDTIYRELKTGVDAIESQHSGKMPPLYTKDWGLVTLFNQMANTVYSLGSSDQNLPTLQNDLETSNLYDTNIYVPLSDLEKIYEAAGMTPPPINGYELKIHEMTDWMQIVDFSQNAQDPQGVYGLVTDLLNASNGITATGLNPKSWEALQKSISQTFIEDTYPDISPKQLATFNKIMGVPPSEMSNHIDMAMADQYAALKSDPSSPNCQALSKVMEAMRVCYWGNDDMSVAYTDFTSWFQTNFVKSKQDYYMQYPNITRPEVGALIAIGGASQSYDHIPYHSALDNEYNKAYNYEEGLDPGSSDASLFQALIGEIWNQGSAGDAAAVQAWAQSIVDTGFLKYPDLNQSTIDEFESITGASSTITKPTGYEEALMEAGALVAVTSFEATKNPTPTTTADAAAAQFLLTTLESAGSVSKALTEINSDFSTHDIYMTYPGITNGTVTTIYKILGGTVPSPTLLDKEYTQAQGFLSTLTPNTNGSALFTALTTEIWGLGSKGSVKDVHSWAKAIVDSNFEGYGDLAQATITEFETITGTAPYQEAMVEAVNFVYQTSEAEKKDKTPTTVANAQAAQYLLKTLRTAGSVSKALTEINSDFSTHDIYMTYPGISKGAVDDFYEILGLSSGPSHSQLDNDFYDTLNYMKGLTPDSNDFKLFQALATEIYSLGSKGSQKSLQTWAKPIVDSNFKGYEPLEPATITEFESITQVTPLNSYDEALIEADALVKATSFEATKNPTPATKADAAAAQFLLTTLKSAGSVSKALTEINSDFSTHDIYMTYPGITNGTVTTIYKILGGTVPSPTLLDKEYTQAQGFLSTLTPNTNGSALFTALTTEIWGLGSKGSVKDVHSWAKAIVDSNFEGYGDLAQATITEFETITGTAPYQKALVEAADFVKSTSEAEKSDPTPTTIANAKAAKDLFDTLRTAGSIEGAITNINQQFSTHDIYMTYPGISKGAVDDFYGILGLSGPYHSQLDNDFYDTLNYMKGLTPDSNDFKLFQALAGEIESLGSAGNLDTLQSWGQAIVKSGFAGYLPMQDPKATIAEFDSITKASLPTLSPFQTAVVEAAVFVEKSSEANAQNPTPTTKANLAAAQFLLSSLESAGSIQGAITSINQSFSSTGKDIYMSFPLISGSAASTFYSILGITPAPKHSALDNALYNTLNYMKGLTPDSNDYSLFQALAGEIESLGSAGSTKTLQAWGQDIVNSNFAGYQPLQQSSITEFESITGATPVTLQTIENETKAYLNNLNTGLQDFTKLVLYCEKKSGFSNHPVSLPTNPTAWSKLISTMTTWSKNLKSQVSHFTTNQQWINLAHKLGFQTNDPQTAKDDINELITFTSNAANWPKDQSSFSEAISLFTSLSKEVNSLIGSGGSVADLTKWAKGVNLGKYPDLTQGEIDEFNKLTGIN